MSEEQVPPSGNPSGANAPQASGSAGQSSSQGGQPASSGQPQFSSAQPNFNQQGGGFGQGGQGQGQGQGRGGRRRRRRRRGKNRGPQQLDANGNPIPQQSFQQQGQGGEAYVPQVGPDGQPLPPPQGAPQGQPGQQQQQQQFQPRPPPPPVQTFAVEGVLDTEVKGAFAFLRNPKRQCASSPDDPEVPRPLVQRLRLRAGQMVTAQATQRGARPQVQRIETVDGQTPDVAINAPHFADLTVVDPVQRIDLEYDRKEMVTRVLDLIAPIGFGQRGLIVAPPKTGKTIMLMRCANAISTNHPKAKLMVLLIDERPEEVTDMRRNIQGEVIASSSDRDTKEHIRLAELTLERAKRLVERGEDVVILLDSITRLARAYNKDIEGSGRTLSGGVDQRALERPKKLFGAARKIEEGGSLTILGTALVDTGSRMDEVIFEEFKGTGNMEVTLDRQLSEKRIWPAINIPASGTRKEEKLMDHKEFDKVKKLRQMLYSMKPADAMEKLVKKLAEYDYNSEFLEEL
ncbi:MAG: transcription termination factor Rho [Deltaproteobacteria bacterium]|nr:transcription termination factor Rho [Deltaproteobacteria bacterium]